MERKTNYYAIAAAIIALLPVVLQYFGLVPKGSHYYAIFGLIQVAITQTRLRTDGVPSNMRMSQADINKGARTVCLSAALGVLFIVNCLLAGFAFAQPGGWQVLKVYFIVQVVLLFVLSIFGPRRSKTA